MVRDVGEVVDLGRVHLLVFGGDEHGGDSDQLEPLLGNWMVLLGETPLTARTPQYSSKQDGGSADTKWRLCLYCHPCAQLNTSSTNKPARTQIQTETRVYLKKAVNNGYSHEESFLEETELDRHLYKPINKDSTHVSGHFLSQEIFRLYTLLHLERGGG